MAEKEFIKATGLGESLFNYKVVKYVVNKLVEEEQLPKGTMDKIYNELIQIDVFKCLVSIIKSL